VKTAGHAASIVCRLQVFWPLHCHLRCRFTVPVDPLVPGLNPHCSQHHCAELELYRWLYLSNTKLPGSLRDHQGAAPPLVLIAHRPPDGIGFNSAAVSVVCSHW
jgi:hypothetical protein